jgi:hypothetical protein
MMDIHVDELQVDLDNQQKQMYDYQHFRPEKKRRENC